MRSKQEIEELLAAALVVQMVEDVDKDGFHYLANLSGILGWVLDTMPREMDMLSVQHARLVHAAKKKHGKIFDLSIGAVQRGEGMIDLLFKTKREPSKP